MERWVKKIVRLIMAVAALLGTLQGVEVATGVDIAPPYREGLSQVDIQPDWVGVSEASRLAGVSRSTVYSWCRSRRITAVKDGRGRWRIDPASLEEVRK